MTGASKHLVVRLCTLLASLGCAAPVMPGARDVRLSAGLTAEEARGPMITPIEMQQDVERFTGQFLDVLVESCQALSAASAPAERRVVLGRVLTYSSSVLDIASGPYPEVNVLDLMVFLRLSRSALERHWIPEVFGEAARPLAAAFIDSEDRAWRLAAKVLSRPQREQLNQLIDAWLVANPDQVRVELVRFEEFSARSAKVASELQSNARGLLGTVRGAARAADQGLLLAERGMFLAHRLPFLMRLQARIGADEMITDSLGRFDEIQDLAAQAAGARQLMDETARLLVDGKAAAHEARLTLQALEPLARALPPLDELQSALSSSNDLADKSLTLLREARALTPAHPEQLLDHVEARADALVRRSLLWLGLAGGVWIVLFWGGYYVVRRTRA